MGKTQSQEQRKLMMINEPIPTILHMTKKIKAAAKNHIPEPEKEKIAL